MEMKDLFSALSPQNFSSDEKDDKDSQEEKLLHALAWLGVPFPKSTILCFAKILGLKMKSTNSFLEKYMDTGVIERWNNSNSEFVIRPTRWISMIRQIEEKECPLLNNIVKTKEHHYNMDDMVSFVKSVYLFFKGQQYTQEYKKNQNLYRFAYNHSFAVSVFLEMCHHEEMFPYIASLPDSIKEPLIDELFQKIHPFKIKEEDASLIKKLIDADVLKMTDKPYVYTSFLDLYGFYYSFVQKLDIQEAKRLIHSQTLYGSIFQAIMWLQDRKYDEALKLFSERLKGHSSAYFIDPLANFYYAWTLMNTTKSVTTRIKNITKEVYGMTFYRDRTMTLLFDAMLHHKKEDAVEMEEQLSRYDAGPLYALVAKHFDMADKPSASLDAAIEKELDQIDAQGVNLLKLEFSNDTDRYKDIREEMMKMSGMHPTMPPHIEQSKWEYTLDELLKINGAGTPSAPTKAQSLKRIAYIVSSTRWDIQPKMQTSKDGVNWSIGRNVALMKLRARTVEMMTDADIKISDCVTCTEDWYGTKTYYLEGPKAMAALIAHPYVFDSNTGTHLDVVEEKIQVSMTLQRKGYHATSNVNADLVQNGYYVRKDGLSTIKIIKVDNTQKETLKKLRDTTFPAEAKDRLKELLERLSGKMVVMSDLLQNNESIKNKYSHSETVVQLRPSDEMILCALVVKPFGNMAPVCHPGKGMETITTTIDGETVQTRRNLKKEKENYNAVLKLMVDYEEDTTEKKWTLEARECLELLEKLREMPKQCVVEWPEGERFKVSYGALLPKSFHLSVRNVDTWFEISGDVQISTDKKIKMAELLEHLSEAKGNFVRVTDNEYIKISGDLLRYIESIERLASINRGKMKISMFNAPQLEGLENSGMNVSMDESYNKLMEKVHNAQEVSIKIPRAINADLRSYQKEGYVWMSRLAQWGAGALLADDMGLGKTVQTITLLLSRAKEGPQLVIVPTSLVMNWKEEIARFAPGLTTLILNRPGENRKEIIDHARKYDIVITTYGLLINEKEILKSKVWPTIVLDEAHTIKNRDTKMSKAAMELKSDFRVLLTGTPLQNHVSEIWNLMQFANPGLLGSFQEYTDRFLLPIEHGHDKEKQKLLKRIITPFMLRRTKNDVLNELPEKTEITLKVDLSEEEWAFYDNIRQKALANMEDKQTTAVQALAEITRLRQAACNTRLVEKMLRLKSSKLERFMELVDDLHENHHRALVFSQFTSHLALVRERLDAQGIKYLYLDGNTSVKDRIKLVEEFQHGDMDLFLISLKAGGLGLNLTAADYVIHLDPWWNPAIEDQASDRAYRIGQKKAVTVYRLIASGTIEEKILELHRTKKNMADALLEGGDVSANMTREEMMELLKQGMEG